MARTVRVLAVDGGGFRGIYASHILQRIEEELAVEWRTSFGLIAGTSTGSIIASALACGIPAREVTKLYEVEGERIFRRRWLHWRGITGSRYAHRPLQEALSRMFEDRKLGEVEVPLILPATDIGNGCVHVFKSNYDPEFVRDRDVLVRDAVLASCSAPTYFDPHVVNTNLLADGGLWANSPALVAAIDARRRLGVNLDDLQILSVGTGISRRFYSQAPRWWHRLVGWGIATRWGAVKFIDTLLNLQAETASNMLRLLLQSDQVLRLNFTSDGDLPLDDPRNRADLVSKADRDFTHNADYIREFMSLPNTAGPVLAKGEV